MKILSRNIWAPVLNQRGKMSSHESYLNLGKQRSFKHCHPAAERNKEPILECLKKYVESSVGSSSALLLEVSSGSGQHVSHFAPHFPHLTFQPTEIERDSIRSINEYISDSKCTNIKMAQYLDVRQPARTWLDGTLQPDSLDYILNINMIHISEWACSKGLFAGAGLLLKPDGLLFTYGPYAFDGVIRPESNVEFDGSLRARNPAWGLRDVQRELRPLAELSGLRLEGKHDLPANNHFLVWRKANKD